MTDKIDEELVDDRILSLLHKTQPAISMIKTEISPLKFLDELWLNFRLTNEECKKRYPNIPDEARERFKNFAFDKDIKDLAETVFMEFLASDRTLLVVASPKKVENPFFLYKHENSTFITGELSNNQYSDIICDIILAEKLDPSFSLNALLLY